MNGNKMFYFEKWGLVLTWLSFSMCATSRGKRWARAESFSVLTCLTRERSNTSPSYAMGKTEVSLTDVLHSADITAASRRLLDVRKFASWMSWRSTWRSTLRSVEPLLHLTGLWVCLIPANWWMYCSEIWKRKYMEVVPLFLRESLWFSVPLEIFYSSNSSALNLSRGSFAVWAGNWKRFSWKSISVKESL